MLWLKRGMSSLARKLLRRLVEQSRTAIEDGIVPGSGGIAFLGDSITAGGRWDLLLPHLPTRNLGIGGDRTDHVLERIAPAIRLAPSKLFLLIGTNDLTVGVPVDTIAGNVARILDELRRALPNCSFYLQSVLPRTADYAPTIATLNERYRKIARERRATFVDLWPLFDDGKGALKASLTNDNLHLLGAGYVVWRDALASYLGGFQSSGAR
ncbi:MAG TPA: GDSL-type esterase/lipase family protein [Nevskiaceae bacterium]|nr:GDSL-type esterase/lipase family protein [Nevskiaceae bacterium]